MAIKEDPHTGRPRILRPASGLLGAYVTARLRGKDHTRQGVFIGHDDSGAALVLGEVQDTPYVCEPNMTVVPDENIYPSSTIEHINRIRAEWAPPSRVNEGSPRDPRVKPEEACTGVNQGMLHALRAVLACRGALPWLARDDMPGTSTSVYDAVLAAVARAERE